MNINSSDVTETDNLIDLNSDGTTTANFDMPPEHNYVNDSVIAASRESHRDQTSLFDVFDMRKSFAASVLCVLINPRNASSSRKKDVISRAVQFCNIGYE